MRSTYPLAGLLLACAALTARGQDAGEQKHADTLDHIKSKRGVSVQELMDHLGNVHKEHWERKRDRMLAAVEGLPTDLNGRDTDNDGKEPLPIVFRPIGHAMPSSAAFEFFCNSSSC